MGLSQSASGPAACSNVHAVHQQLRRPAEHCVLTDHPAHCTQLTEPPFISWGGLCAILGATMNADKALPEHDTHHNARPALSARLAERSRMRRFETLDSGMLGATGAFVQKR